MGMFNWTGISGVDPRPYATAIKYYCPRPGWGYPSNGENETTIYCQQDGTWSNDANIETCISKSNMCIALIKQALVLGINKYLQSCPVHQHRHQLQMVKDQRGYLEQKLLCTGEGHDKDLGNSLRAKQRRQ